MLSTGVGGLRPNTIVLEFFSRDDNVAEFSADDVPCIQVISEMESYISQSSKGAKQKGGGVTQMKLLRRGFSNGVRTEKEWAAVVRTALMFKKNVIVARHFNKMRKDFVSSPSVVVSESNSFHRMTAGLTIDIWASTNDNFVCDYGGHFSEIGSACRWDALEGVLSLQLNLAYGLHKTGAWTKRTRMRVMLGVLIDETGGNFSASSSYAREEKEGGAAEARYDHLYGMEHDRRTRGALESARRRAQKLVDDVRVPCEVHCFPLRSHPLPRGVFSPEPYLELCKEMNGLVRRNSEKTIVAFLPLGPPPPRDAPDEHFASYLDALDALTAEVPPALLTGVGSLSSTQATDL